MPSIVPEHPGHDRRAGHLGRAPSGVVINMVTKSGTNRFGGLAAADLPGARRRSGTTSTRRSRPRVPAEANAPGLHHEHQRQAGGPLVRNRLFYFASMNFQPTHVNVPGFPAVAPLPVLLGDTSQQDTTDILTRSRRKLTYQLEPEQPLRGHLRIDSSATTSRTAARHRRHAGFELEGVRHLQHRAGAVEHAC